MRDRDDALDAKDDEIARLQRQLAHWESGDRDYAELLAEGRKMSLTLISKQEEIERLKAYPEVHAEIRTGILAITTPLNIIIDNDGTWYGKIELVGVKP